MSDLLRERERFEAWALDNGYYFEVAYNNPENYNEKSGYKHPGIRAAWKVWQARAALAAAAPPPDRNDLLAVGRVQSQHDAGGSRSSPADVPSTTKDDDRVTAWHAVWDALPMEYKRKCRSGLEAALTFINDGKAALPIPPPTSATKGQGSDQQPTMTNQKSVPPAEPTLPTLPK